MGKIKLNWFNPRQWTKKAKGHYLPCLDFSLFPYQPLKADGHWPWLISVFVSKVPGVEQRCFAAVLGETPALRETQQSAAPSWALT